MKRRRFIRRPVRWATRWARRSSAAAAAARSAAASNDPDLRPVLAHRPHTHREPAVVRRATAFHDFVLRSSPPPACMRSCSSLIGIARSGRLQRSEPASTMRAHAFRRHPCPAIQIRPAIKASTAFSNTFVLSRRPLWPAPALAVVPPTSLRARPIASASAFTSCARKRVKLPSPRRDSARPEFRSYTAEHVRLPETPGAGCRGRAPFVGVARRVSASSRCSASVLSRTGPRSGCVRRHSVRLAKAAVVSKHRRVASGGHRRSAP